MDDSRSVRGVAVLMCVVSLTSVACGAGPTKPDDPSSIAGSSSGHAGASAGTSGAAGSSGGTNAAAPPGTELIWDAEGFVAPDNNAFAIQGPFYAYSDCDPPSGLPCTAPDPALTGADAKPGWSVDAGRVCMKGTAVKVENMMFAAQWGAGLALDLNSKGGEPGKPAEKGTFDLAAAKITGFSADISGTAPARIRINLTMPGVGDSNFVDAKVPGTTTFALPDAKQGNWVMVKTPLDPTKVEALQFQVFTNAASATPYDFCIDAIRVLTEAP
ncbi:MAG TPA: hypothetical protein VHP33_07425 [Polyangiaceae bacterium]|nr:hypothetical protein [Polyangiaceae bacterium]